MKRIAFSRLSVLLITTCSALTGMAVTVEPVVPVDAGSSANRRADKMNRRCAEPRRSRNVRRSENHCEHHGRSDRWEFRNAHHATGDCADTTGDGGVHHQGRKATSIRTM